MSTGPQSSLTILFEAPFWIGLYERTDNGKYEVCKITFGSEPKDYEVYEFLLKNWHKLKFSPPIHIETVCALSKLDIYQKITVNLKMDELDVTAAETKATYEEIREYVKEHTGLNVSDLYIAQVKRKCGIKERQNYNKPKAENPKRLKCPAEKERAIREALKYFKMI